MTVCAIYLTDSMVKTREGLCAERVKVTTRQTNLIQFGDKNLDLAAVEQLVDKSQTRAIADALNLLRTWAACPPHTGQPLATLLSTLEEQLDSQVNAVTGTVMCLVQWDFWLPACDGNALHFCGSDATP